MAVDGANEVAYSVPALGQTGYEKIAPLNTGTESDGRGDGDLVLQPSL